MIEPVSDGCTGFWWAEAIWPIHQCCVDHDFGGSDGELLDCIVGAGVPVGLAALALLVMVLLRPAYEALLKLTPAPRKREGDEHQRSADHQADAQPNQKAE